MRKNFLRPNCWNATLLTGMMALLSFSGAAQAAPLDPITDLGLYNTGVDINGAALEGGIPTDPHYVALVSADPGNPGPNAPVIAPGAIPAPPWEFNTAISRWISATSKTDTTSDSPGGIYVYRTTFDTGALDPLSLSITGQYAADDFTALAILVNGVPNPAPSTGFTFQDFTLDTGFVAGLNTIDFEVTNGDGVNPHGLHVQFLAADGVVPEPGSMILLALGGAMLVGFARRRR